MTILTDERGRPFERPRREDFATDHEFVRAYHEYRDRVSACAKEAFDKGLRNALV